MKGTEEFQVVWQEREIVLTLEGETVLCCRMCWPWLEGGGRGARRINRCYGALARGWEARWRRKIYWLACLELAQRRAESRPFTPWRGELRGEVALQAGNLLSLSMEGEEVRGDGRVCRVRWGDVWKVREGAPCPLKEVLSRKRGWKKALCRQIVREGEARQRAGEWVPDPGWQKKVGRLLAGGEYCLRGEELEFAFPQCAIAPAAEGTPVFRVTRAGAAG